MPPRKKPAPADKPKAKIATHKHKDSRTNIPTAEQAQIVDTAPKKILYPRDPSLDPQLVWKGKDEQDREALEVPAVPVYIQEKIHPQAIIEDIRQRAAGTKPAGADLFSDFNGLDDFSKKVDFYHHDQHWTNRMILGDSLLVMTSLAEKERLKGQVQCIYFDPPYGIKFGSNWQVSTRKKDVKDAKAEDATRQPEQIKAFRDTWKLGIHSYLSYLRDRLQVARELLTESGSVYVQIGDDNAHLLRCVMDEIFGSDNFVSVVSYGKTTSSSANTLPVVNDYIVWYAKNRESIKYRQIYKQKVAGSELAKRYDQVELPEGSRRVLTPEERDNLDRLSEKWKLFTLAGTDSQGFSENTSRPFEFGGVTYTPGHGRHWSTSLEGMKKLAIASRLQPMKSSLRFVRYLNDYPAVPLNNNWYDIGGIQDRIDGKIYVVQTSATAIERCILMSTDPGDIVLDPTCGSGTSAYVAEEWGRRWITTDTSRVALALARTRLMCARFPFYLLADSPEGRKKARELAGVLADDARGDGDHKPDIRQGFVYKKVPHVTLKSIANNPDIKEGMSRAEIDAAIARHADTETLYDQPYEDKGTLRVTGPYTVESLSPHRMLPTNGEGEPEGRKRDVAESDNPSFLATILDNLRKAGVQNTVKGERIVFDRLDTYPGVLVNAEGEFTEAGERRTVRVSIGPEFGTVGPDWIQDAAKEAIKGSRADVLLVCAFSFDPHVYQMTADLKKEVSYGKLRILPVKMNPDLAMGDELLKKTGSGNLFMVFGEPDIKTETTKDGRVTVEIFGVDVYDPTSGEVRSNGTDDIACWFIDTDYNDESFFVRHAYFCGGNDPYEKLKRDLKAEVDEAEWAKLYATKSVPFDKPKKGRIAVKVINHYGDEVLKVYKV